MQQRTAGWAIIVSALLTLVAIAHHPTVHAVDPSQLLSQIRAISGADRLVHGVIIALLGAVFFGFTVFSSRLGLHRSAPLVALISFAAATMAVCGAALIDGFLVPDVARKFAAASPGAMQLATGLLAQDALAIQVLTRFAIVASSVAVAFWSLALVGPRYRLWTRIVGIAGLIAAAYVIVAIGAVSYLVPHSLLQVLAAQYAWHLLAGVLLVRDDFETAAPKSLAS